MNEIDKLYDEIGNQLKKKEENKTLCGIPI